MKPPIFSQEWAEALGQEPEALSMTADAPAGIADDRAVFLDLHHGACRGARAAEPADFEAAAFVLEAGGGGAAGARRPARGLDPAGRRRVSPVRESFQSTSAGGLRMDLFPMRLDEFVAFATDQFQKRHRRIERSRRQSLDEVLFPGSLEPEPAEA